MPLGKAFSQSGFLFICVLKWNSNKWCQVLPDERQLDSENPNYFKISWSSCEWESQFLGRLIRSPGSPRRRKGSGALKVETGVWNSQEEKDKLFFPLHSLVLVNYTTQFKLCTRDYTTTMYPVGGQFLLPEILLTNPDILEWEWVWRIFLLLNSNLDILKCKLWEWVW